MPQRLRRGLGPALVLLLAPTLGPALAVLIALAFVPAPRPSPAAPAGPQAVPSSPAPVAGDLHWYKGNLHTHSLWSDGDDFPEMIVDWYKSHGYQFLALSDHNTLQAGEKWVKFGDLKRKNAGDALPKYRARFGEEVHTRGSEAAANLEIRLRTLDAYRGTFDEPGKFLLVQSEEITAAVGQKPIHMNATNIGEAIKAAKGTTIREVIEGNLRAVAEQAARLHRPILPHLNHPNFGWGVSVDDLAAVVEEHFFEVYNGHPAVHQQGDDTRPSVERMWDVANTIRLAQLHAAPLFGLATDDSHNYHVTGMNRSGPGRGWVMVRSASLDVAALIRAMEAGDFYASSGVTLRDVRYAPAGRTLELEIEPQGNATYTTQFVGTPADFDPAGANPVASDKVGVVFATVRGPTASYTLTGKELYVRAVVTADQPPENPSFKGQLKQAWTQPVGWEARPSANHPAP